MHSYGTSSAATYCGARMLACDSTGCVPTLGPVRGPLATVRSHTRGAAGNGRCGRARAARRARWPSLRNRHLQWQHVV